MIISIADKPFLSLSLFPLYVLPCLCRLLDVRAAREQMHIGGVTYPTLPLQEAAARPQSVYTQHSAACSPAGSFTGSLPPQPHSAYFSGMTGPQHPFYNRVRKHYLHPIPTTHSKRCLYGQMTMLTTQKWHTIGAFRPNRSKDYPLGWSHVRTYQ